MRIRTVLHDHPLIAYFALAFGITWSGILLVLASVGFHTSAIGLAQIGLMFLAMAAGPSLSGSLLTLLIGGRAGVRELLARLGRWRLGLGWYAIAVFTVPALALTILSALALTGSPAFTPSFAPIGFAIGLVAGFFEEIGWTGFALPRLQARHSTFTAGLILGVVWALWHILADFAGNIDAMGAVWLPHFVVFWLAPLVAYRLLMTWVYKNTGSLLLAQLMHAAYTGSLLVFSPASASLGDNMIWQATFALGLWLFVGLVAAAYGRRLAPQDSLS